MNAFDLVVQGGTIATAADTFACDVGIRDGRIAALGHDLASAEKVIDATGKLVLPGGIDSHVHFAQPSGPDIVMADDFERHALGGLRQQHHRAALLPPAERLVPARGGEGVAAEAEEERCYVDVSFHLIIADPTEQVLGQELPALIEDSYLLPRSS